MFFMRKEGGDLGSGRDRKVIREGIRIGIGRRIKERIRRGIGVGRRIKERIRRGIGVGRRIKERIRRGIRIVMVSQSVSTRK